jgi:hypothetical protein
MLVPHAAFLVTQLFRVQGVFLDLIAQALYLLLIIVQALTEVLFHIFNFGILGKQMQQVLNFQNVVLVDDLEGFFDVDFFLGRQGRVVAVEFAVSGLWVGVVEEVLGNFHPKLLLELVLVWLVGVFLGKFNVFALQC